MSVQIETIPTADVALQVAPLEDRTKVHESTVAAIVQLVIAKFNDESHKNFAIGKRAFEHAQWQRGNFPGYEASDYDALMRRIRDDVRVYVSVKADSIRVAQWASCHALREQVRIAIGDDADALSMHEYIVIVGKALRFDKTDVSGSLVPGWIGMIRGVADERKRTDPKTGLVVGRVTSENFQARVTETEKAIAALAASADPVKAAAALASNAVKERAANVAKVNRDLTTALSDGLSSGLITTDAALTILEHVAREHKQPMPQSIGFDPANCTPEDCDLLCETLHKLNKVKAIRRLAKKLGRMAAALDTAQSIQVKSVIPALETTTV